MKHLCEVINGGILNEEDKSDISNTKKEYIKKLDELRNDLLKTIEPLAIRLGDIHKNVKDLLNSNRNNRDEYVNRWYSRGIEPPEKLKFILFRVAEKYGIETEGTTPFTFSAYLYKGFRFELLIGQGSAVNIYKLNN